MITIADFAIQLKKFTIVLSKKGIAYGNHFNSQNEGDNILGSNMFHKG